MADEDSPQADAPDGTWTYPRHAVLAATQQSVAAARTAGTIGGADEGAVLALLVLAQKIDRMVDEPMSVGPDGELREDRRYMLDNVTMPTYLKYCDALGLTPAGRRALDVAAKRRTGKLASVRSIGPQAAGA